MINKVIIGIISFILIVISLYIYNKSQIKKLNLENNKESLSNKKTSASNVIENVEYSSRDSKGNEYIIRAKQGEVDIKQNNIIFLERVEAFINLKNSNQIFIFADFGKYNINNFDTIFSKNVIIKYLDKKISSEYLDFSILRNSMIISKKVIYKDKNNILNTDVIEVDIESKDTKFFMHDINKKIKILSQN